MGRPEPTSEERQARRDALMDAAVEAIREHGPNASMEDLAKSAGVTKPILYRHFGHRDGLTAALATRSEEHTSELQSRLHLVCRLLLEKKKETLPTHVPHNSQRSPHSP